MTEFTETDTMEEYEFIFGELSMDQRVHLILFDSKVNKKQQIMLVKLKIIFKILKIIYAFTVINTF
jgi:hypothetical protein